MEHSFAYFAASMAMLVTSRLIDIIHWKNKNEELWIIISRVISILALITSIKALTELMVWGQIYWNIKR